MGKKLQKSDLQIIKNRKHEIKCQNENIKLQCIPNKIFFQSSSFFTCSKSNKNLT